MAKHRTQSGQRQKPESQSVEERKSEGRFHSSVAIVATVISLLQAVTAWMQYKTTARQADQSLLLQARVARSDSSRQVTQFERDWRLRAGELLASHQRELFSRDSAEFVRMQRVIVFTFPADMVAEIYRNVAASAADRPTRKQWQVASKRAEGGDLSVQPLPPGGIATVRVSGFNGNAVPGLDVLVAPADQTGPEEWSPNTQRIRKVGKSEQRIVVVGDLTPGRVAAWAQVPGRSDRIGFTTGMLEDIDVPIALTINVPDSIENALRVRRR